MAYSTNPSLPRVRRDAVRLVRAGWSMRKVARHFGFDHSAVVRWVARAPADGRLLIPTRSSRPRHHPQELPFEVVARILSLRHEREQCAEILHYRLTRERALVSLSSVKRILRRYHCSRFSSQKRWHTYPPRPIPARPGLLVQIDTILDGAPEERLNVYTGLDVCSRFAFARPATRLNTHASWEFVRNMRHESPFAIGLIQSDHGAEFSKWFTKQCLSCDLAHRHSRVRRPTDNGHLERFNRTLEEECLNRIPRSLTSWRKEIPAFLRYYNEERPIWGSA